MEHREATILVLPHSVRSGDGGTVVIGGALALSNDAYATAVAASHGNGGQEQRDDRESLWPDEWI